MNHPVDRRIASRQAAAASAMLDMQMTLAKAQMASGVQNRPLYVSRSLTNAADLAAWAKRVGIQNVVAASEMHVTICYSRTPVDWLAIGNDYRDTVTVEAGGPRVLARFGKDEAKVAVLCFASSDLEWRHQEMVERGASFDFDRYRPHVTLGVDLPADFDLDAVEPYTGPLKFGPEIFEAIDSDREATLAKVGWSKQPRVPSGPKGGQWTAGGYAGSKMGAIAQAAWGDAKAAIVNPAGWKAQVGAAMPTGPKLTLPWLGQDDMAAHRYKADPQQAAFMKPMKESELTGQPAWLGNEEGIVNKTPQTPTRVEDNDNPDDRATFVAGHDPGEGLNGLAFTKWDGPPGGDWSKVGGTGDFDEPAYPATKGKRLGAGVVITEPDGRIWTLSPTNAFGGYFETLPKGGIEKGLDLRQTAIKEAYEESGLKIKLTGVIGDFERNTSVARYYRAERVGGDPTDYHWETAGTHLVPPADLDDALHHVNDKPILQALKGASGDIIKLALGFADLVERMGFVVDFEKAKAWSTQPRVPAGLPTGGQWSKGGYGSGGWGILHAEGGVPLVLQKYGGTGPQADALNQKIMFMESAANKGYLHDFVAKAILKPKPLGTYTSAAWESAQEAASYVNAMKANVGAAKAKVAPTETKAKPEPMGTVKDPMDLSTLTKIGPKPGGSADGALYKDASGQQWIVKSYDSAGMAFNEVTASKLYQQMGVATPEMKLIDLGGAHKGGIGVASKMMDLSPLDKNNPAHIKAAQADFAAHALMANWDAVGLSFDNLMIDKATGQTVMVDPGGSLLYRAQGTPKLQAFTDNVTELDTMRDPLKNPTSAAIFGKMTEEQIVDSMQKAISGIGMGNGSNISMTKQAMDAIDQNWGGADKSSVTMKLVDKLDNRLVDMSMKANAMAAAHHSTSTLDVTKTGTTTATASHPNHKVQSLINTNTVEDLEVYQSMLKGDIAEAKSEMTGSSADFYSKKLDALQVMAEAGDIDGIAAAIYTPNSAKANLSHNYGKYKAGYKAVYGLATANAALAAKAMGRQGDGGMVTGAAKVSPSDINVAVKQAGMNAPDSNMLHPDWAAGGKNEATLNALDGDPTNLGAQIDAANLAEASGTIPKPAAKQVLNTLPGMPVKPKLSSPANPNAKLVALADEIAKIAESGDPDAAAKVQALSATIKGSNSFSMKAKTYAANVVAALGGQAQIDAMPAAAKKAAMEKGIDAAAKIHAPKQTLPGGAVVETYTANGVVYEKTTSFVAFDRKSIPEPPNFAAFNGGQPLSSKPEVNAANNASVQALYAKAMDNDLKGLMGLDITVPGFASLPDSAKASLPGGANKHVAGYKSHLISYLQSVGQQQTKEKVLGFANGGSIGSAMAGISEKFKAKGPWTPGATKVGGYIASGSIGSGQAKAFWDSMPMITTTPDGVLAGKLKDLTYSQPRNAQQAMKAHVSGKSDAGWSQMQAALFTGKKGDKNFDIAMQNAKDLSEGVYEMPAGFVVGRKIPKYGTVKEWQAAIDAGDVLNIPALSSTAITPDVWSGEMALKMKFAPGAKAAYVGKASKATKTGPIGNIGLGGENEVILPKNTKIVPIRIYTNDGTDDFFGKNMKGQTIVEVLIIGNDDPEIH